MRRLWWAGLILCVLPACGGRYGWIGTEAQAPFRRCVCSHPNCTARQSQLAEEYAESTNREAWLAAHSCDANGYRSSTASPEMRRRIAQRERDERAARAELVRPRLTRETDEFTGRTSTTFRTGVPLRQASSGFVLFSLFVLEDGTGGLMINASFPEWRWLRCHRLDLMVNGAPFPMAEPAGHQGDTGRGYVTESVTRPVSAAELEVLRAASSIRFRVCNDVMEVPADALAVLRAEPAGAAPSPAPEPAVDHAP